MRDYRAVRKNDKSSDGSDTAGVEIATKINSVTIKGWLDFGGPGTGIIVRGSQHHIVFRTGWAANGTGLTASRVLEPITGSTIEINGGGGKGGTVLDLSASGLDKTNGLGNRFVIRWGGGATLVIYPGGGTKFNLAPGTDVTINGVVQK